MYILFTTAEKNTKAIRLRIKCTITKVIKFDDNNLGRKLIFIKLKSKIQRYSYLPRINLCELFNEAKQRLSMQREPFYYFTVLRNYPFMRSFYSYTGAILIFQCLSKLTSFSRLMEFAAIIIIKLLLLSLKMKQQQHDINFEED